MPKKKPLSSKPYKVFVSHATTDKWIAKVLCEKIESTGAATFRDDRDIDGGDDIPDKIRAQIKACRELVVLLTPDSVHRQWVLLEIGAAWGWSRNKRITGIRCHVDIEPIPAMLRSTKVININECDAFLAELKKRVAQYNDNN